VLVDLVKCHLLSSKQDLWQERGDLALSQSPKEGDEFVSSAERGMEEAAPWGRAGGRGVSEAYGPGEPRVG